MGYIVLPFCVFGYEIKLCRISYSGVLQNNNVPTTSVHLSCLSFFHPFVALLVVVATRGRRHEFQSLKSLMENNLSTCR